MIHAYSTIVEFDVNYIPLKRSLSSIHLTSSAVVKDAPESNPYSSRPLISGSDPKSGEIHSVRLLTEADAVSDEL